jgi:hypothetical protein
VLRRLIIPWHVDLRDQASLLVPHDQEAIIPAHDPLDVSLGASGGELLHSIELAGDSQARKETKFDLLPFDRSFIAI